MSRDPGLVLEMLLAAREVVDLTPGLTREQLELDRRSQLAVLHLIQIVGEAARSISDSYKHTHPEIPWPQIVGMRHWLVHDYTRVNLDLVFSVVTNDIPELIAKLTALVPPRSAEA